MKLFESNDRNKDNEKNLDLLDDLDLFAYGEIIVNGKKTNTLLEALS